MQEKIKNALLIVFILASIAVLTYLFIQFPDDRDMYLPIGFIILLGGISIIFLLRIYKQPIQSLEELQAQAQPLAPEDETIINEA